MDRAVEVMRTRRIIHEASLARFLFFVNPLSSDRKCHSDNFAIQSGQCRDIILTTQRRSASYVWLMALTAAPRTPSAVNRDRGGLKAPTPAPPA